MTPAGVEGRLVGKPRRADRALAVLSAAAVLIILAMLAIIVLDIVAGGSRAVSWEFLSTNPREGMTAGGVFPAIFGTVVLTLLMTLAAVPAGVATAIYLTEYASKRSLLARLVRVCVANLAGVPSIVFGLFGLGLFVLFFHCGASILAGSLTLACMVLPTIIVASEEALRAVPLAFREGSLALGATKWQSIWTNVLPYSLPGMLTGSILAVGRAAGETAPILLTVAAFFLPKLPSSVFDQVMALPYNLYILATQHPNADKVRPLQYGTALTLVALVLAVNLAAIILRSRIRKKYRW
jgi:phosphate transport system permease protein